jgi:DNA polymerase III subunit gamma/tau
MEQFVVSARKYRPQTFNDVVGQKAITSTLLHAIESNHLASALLFTGPRGVGKTTCARILARKINQPGYDDPNEDFAFNVFELDAASNNSVDDIRNLIDQVRIPPQTGKYKVYIIDEVHMLSSAAFNAFLKTLEEPPKHAIFILATTEKHKIIPTILSRCQIFDFKRITVKDAKEHLAEVATSQGVNFEDDALHIIAQKADGAMRDALSIFDRVVSYCGSNLTRQAVTENLNVLDYETYITVTDLILENKIPLFGICLGHQLLALAIGAKTHKMSQGHRGANHPVQDLRSKKVEITSQNHGFCVEAASIPSNAEVTHISLFDNSVEGLRLKDKLAFSVQYHPESSPGPDDSFYLFEQFVELMKENGRS